MQTPLFIRVASAAVLSMPAIPVAMAGQWFAHSMAAVAAALWLVTVTLKPVLPDTRSPFD